MNKPPSITSLGLLPFFLLLPFSLGAQDSFDAPIFSPVAEEFKQYPSSTVLYSQYNENGSYYLNQGLYSEAKDLFWKAIHLYPQNPDAYVNLGIVHMQQNELESALRILKKAEKLASSDYNQAEILYYNLGMCFFLQEKYPPAVTYFEKAVGEFADFAQGRYDLGRSYLRLGQNEKAYVNIFIASYIYEQKEAEGKTLKLKQFLRNIASSYNLDNISLANTFLEYGRVALADQEIDRAVVLLEESVSLNPSSIYANYELALLYLRKKAYHNAITYLNKTIEADLNFIKGYLALNQVYRKIEKYDLAAEILEAALAIEQGNPWIHYNMALTYIEAQEFNTARKYLAEAKIGALNNEDNLLLKEIHEAYDLIGQFKKAKVKPPYYPKKIRHKSAEPIYPDYPVSGNAGNLDKGYFR